MPGIQNLRSEILIKKVLRSGYSMESLEQYFNISSERLLGGLKNFLKFSPNDYETVVERAYNNRAIKSLER